MSNTIPNKLFAVRYDPELNGMYSGYGYAVVSAPDEAEAINAVLADPRCESNGSFLNVTAKELPFPQDGTTVLDLSVERWD